MLRIIYKKDNKADFFFTVQERVNAYFNSGKISKKTNAFGIFKAVFFCIVYAVLYSFTLLANGNNGLLLTSFTLMGFIQICIVLNLGHEGAHSNFSNRKWVNKLLCYSFDLIGSSGYLWKMRHVYSHHQYPMIPEYDVDIQQTGTLTFQPLKYPKPFFRYQKFYAPFLYCFFTINAILKRDFKDFFSGKIGIKKISHTRLDYILFILSKILYFTYILILPIFLSGSSVATVLLGFLCMHITASLTAVVALFPAHLYEDSIFPQPNEKGEINTTWAEHQMRVTMDFGTGSPLVAFFFGGINYHAVHHLFPSIAHVHFPVIRKIVQSTADEFGIPYNQKSLSSALYSHWLLLDKNGMAHMDEFI
ncbi:MAG: fatty acid desaturase family protein [Sphingobacteriales bacterium]